MNPNRYSGLRKFIAGSVVAAFTLPHILPPSANCAGAMVAEPACAAAIQNAMKELADAKKASGRAIYKNPRVPLFFGPPRFFGINVLGYIAN